MTGPPRESAAGINQRAGARVVTSRAFVVGGRAEFASPSAELLWNSDVGDSGASAALRLAAVGGLKLPAGLPAAGVTPRSTEHGLINPPNWPGIGSGIGSRQPWT